MTQEKTIDPKAPSSGGRTATADGLILPITGLGVWNLYFLAKFGLAWAGYLNLSPLWNALFIAALLTPLRRSAVPARSSRHRLRLHAPLERKLAPED